MQQRVQNLHRRHGAFVRGTTPHCSGTSREGTYSVAYILQHETEKVNTYR